jgi:V/A-type H+-transporting ATPase subunit K
MNGRGLAKRYVGSIVMLTLILAAFCIASGVGVATAFGQEKRAVPVSAVPGAATAQAGGEMAGPRWDLSVAIAVSIAVPCLAAGYAVGRVGAAALGAASEKPELLTRSLLFVALAEGIAIYGLLVAVLLYRKL